MKLCVVNWKMNLTFQQELLFFKDHLEELNTWKNKLIVCPSFPALAPLFSLLKETDVALGAQDCSEYHVGPYTGQVSAQSLIQTGCSYVLVGHPEQRALGITPHHVAQKALQVLQAGMIPIIFIEESWHAHITETTLTEFMIELAPLQEILGNSSHYLAYKPAWNPETLDLNHTSGILFWLKQQLPGAAMLYAGPVNEAIATSLHSLEPFKGVILEESILDFQHLKKIVSLIH